MPGRSATGPARSATPAELAGVFQLFQAGRHAEMEAAADALAQRCPQDGQTWKALGIARLVQRKDALAALQRAMDLLPRDAEVPSNLGAAFNAQGRLDEAVACYRRALALQPGLAQAHCNLCDLLARQGRWADAESHGREALRLQPGLAAALVNLGNALQGQGRLDAALACYRQAAVQNPRQAEAHRQAGSVLKALGRPAEAQGPLRQALACQPGHGPTLLLLGLVLQALGQRADAEPLLRQAVQAQAGVAGSHFHLGNLLADLHRPGEAAACFQQALALDPAFVQAQANLGLALGAAGRPAEALLALQAAVEGRPDDPVLRSNLGNALLASGRYDDAVCQQQLAAAQAPGLAVVQGNLGHALKAAGRPEAALPALRLALAAAPADLARHSECLFTQLYAPPASAARRRVDAERFGAAAARAAQAFTDWPQALPPGPAGGLRVGLLSADLRQHPVGYFTASVLAALAAAPGRLALLAYANHRQDDAMSQRLRSHCQAWRWVADLDDGALAAQIRADGVHILIDLAGHTLGNRLPVLAWRPAPLQVSWLGYGASTGLAGVDAFIADPWLAPAGAEAAFVEPLLRLPESFLCFTPPDLPLPVGPLPALAGGGIRFACFNQLAKLNDAVVALWSRILRALPTSTLLLQCAPLQDEALCQQVLGRFAAHGVAAHQLRLQPAQPRAAYLAALGQADIVLDPFPYPGGTTTLEALWMGVPVLTLPGESALSRQGLSILQNLGLPDWVARDEADYLARALRHAGDLPALAGLRRGLRARLLASPLCDAPRFARHLGAALQGLWQGRANPGPGPSGA